jgi:predicted  nucleic acid-binding Zn-ribbon protein
MIDIKETEVVASPDAEIKELEDRVTTAHANLYALAIESERLNTVISNLQIEIAEAKKETNKDLGTSVVGSEPE